MRPLRGTGGGRQLIEAVAARLPRGRPVHDTDVLDDPDGKTPWRVSLYDRLAQHTGLIRYEYPTLINADRVGALGRRGAS